MSEPIKSTFLRSSSIFPAALALTLNTASPAFSHKNHDHDVNHAYTQFTAEDICDTSTGLHEIQSNCYEKYAKNMELYALSVIEPWADLSPENILTRLNAMHASYIDHDPEKQKITARWFKEGTIRTDDKGRVRGTLHRENGPAVIQIDLATGAYAHFYAQDGSPIIRDNGLPGFLRYVPNQTIDLQWENTNGFHNNEGPAVAQENKNENILSLEWWKQGSRISLNGSPTYASINLETGIAYIQDWQSDDQSGHQNMHRHDCAFEVRHDPITGLQTSILYHWHDRDVSTDDEIELQIISDGTNGKFTKAIWYHDNTIIAEQSPEQFSIPQSIEPFELPSTENSHYCDAPDHIHQIFTPEYP